MSVPMHPSRRLRIVGKPGDTHGYMLSVFDHDTGEEVGGIFRIALELDVRKSSSANITYYVSDDHGHLLSLGEGDGPIERTDIVEVVEIDVTAIEDIED